MSTTPCWLVAAPLLWLAALLAAPAAAQAPDSLVLRLTLASPAGEGPADEFGYAVASAGDLTGDGTDEIVVADPYENDPRDPDDPDDDLFDVGAVYVFDGATGALRLTLRGFRSDGALFGWAVASAGDLDGDAVPDIVVGATDEPPNPPGQGFEVGAVYTFSGATGARLWRATHPDPYEFADFGKSVAGVGDASGDGVGDVAVGSKFETHLLSGADGSLVWAPGGLSLGESVAAAGDVDGDGVGDIAAGSSQYEGPGQASQAGGVRLLSGATGAILYEVLSPSPEPQGGFGRSVAGIGDLNGDGVGDLAVGASNEGPRDGNLLGPGQVYLISGTDGAALGALRSPSWPAVPAFFGWDVAGGDLTGDSISVVAVGAPREGPETAGLVHLYSSASGLRVQTVLAPESARLFGRSVAFVGQAAKRTALVVGAPSTAGGGRVYVYGWPEPVASSPSPQASGLSVSVSPVPSSGAASVVVAVASPSPVRVAVVDALGRTVAVVHDGPLGAGRHRLALPSALAPGVYAVRVDSGEASPTARWVVARWVVAR